MADRDFLLDEKGELVLRNGGMATANSLTQEVGLLLLTNQGEMRQDPLCGCNIVRRMFGKITRAEMERILRLQVERDGKLWGTVKGGINLLLRNG
jgi:hypothetical protein